jgi:hypothetical protein
MTKKTVYTATACNEDGEYIDRFTGPSLQHALLKLAASPVVEETLDIRISVGGYFDFTPLTIAENLGDSLCADASPALISELCRGLLGELVKEEVDPSTGAVTFQLFVFPDGSRFFVNHDADSWGPEKQDEEGEERT